MELLAQGMLGEGREAGVLVIHLLEHTAQTQPAAECVAAVGKVHLSDLVGICLQQHGHARVSDGGLDAVFIAEVGQAHDDSVVLAPMFVQEIGVDHALGGGLHRTEMGAFLWELNKLHVAAARRLAHILAGGVDHAAGKKSAVRDQKRKFDVHLCILLPNFLPISLGIPAYADSLSWTAEQVPRRCRHCIAC